MHALGKRRLIETGKIARMMYRVLSHVGEVASNHLWKILRTSVRIEFWRSRSAMVQYEYLG
jgi:hypothetical protein